MYGWRAKIGHVAPSRGDTLVYEFYQMLPEGFMILNSTGTIRATVGDSVSSGNSDTGVIISTAAGKASTVGCQSKPA